ncbi:hypothetical protein B0H11DRAFT_1929364 [Mycena galericulata]|nr:hypothetical protein B0H11DRAFT_1929364 [Mycena galericulata]
MAPVQSRVWADSESHIQDRADPSHFFDRCAYGGHWWGPDECPTWVHEVGVGLGTPNPPFVSKADRNKSTRPSVVSPAPPAKVNCSPSPSRRYGHSPDRGYSPPYASSSKTASSSSGSQGGYYHYGPNGNTHRNSGAGGYWEQGHVASTRMNSPARGNSPPRRYPDHGRAAPPRGRIPSWRGQPPRQQSRSPPRRGDRGYQPRHDQLRHDPMGPPGARAKWQREEDNTLRQLAVDSRAPRAPVATTEWVRTTYPPPINEAPLSADGHPICPLEVDTSDADDYGSDSEAPTLPVNWRATEKIRQLDAAEHIRLGRRVRTFHVPHAEDLGLWNGLRVVSLDDTANVLRWISRTEPMAYHFMRNQCLTLGSREYVTQARTDGQVYLLKKQNPAAEEFWLESTGKKKGPPGDYTTSPDPPATDAPLTEHRFTALSNAAQGDDDTTVIVSEAPMPGEVYSGTHTRLDAAARLYDEMETKYWPFGFRIDENTWPSTRRAAVYLNDVLAWYTINALAPRRNRTSTSIDRARFMELLVRGLSVAGMYYRFAQIGDYASDVLPFEHYPFLAQNMSFSHVVAWLVQHGIHRDSNDVKILESFCRSRCNATHKSDSPCTTEFTQGSPPLNERDMLSYGAAEIIPWADLCHAPLQPNVTSGYPAHPAAATPAMPVDEDTDMASGQTG